MKLASLKEGGRDGTLIVVDRELKRAVRATGIVPTLQKAIEDWANVAPRLADLAGQLRDDKAPGSFELDTDARSRHRCRVPTSGPTARPTSSMSSWSARRAASRCRPASGPIR